VSNTDLILSFKKNPFKVLRLTGDHEVFEAAFTNEACAAMHAIYLQNTVLPSAMFSVIRPDGESIAARQYRMSPNGNKIERVLQ
jgi:hypothetical protein